MIKLVNMMIEWLRFRVPVEKRTAFLQKDEEIWTTALQEFPGFLGKETWVDPENQDIIFVIRWSTKELWKAVSEAEIIALDQQMGNLWMPMIESREYQVCPFEFD